MLSPIRQPPPPQQNPPCIEPDLRAAHAQRRRGRHRPPRAQRRARGAARGALRVGEGGEGERGRESAAHAPPRPPGARRAVSACAQGDGRQARAGAVREARAAPSGATGAGKAAEGRRSGAGRREEENSPPTWPWRRCGAGRAGRRAARRAMLPLRGADTERGRATRAPPPHSAAPAERPPPGRSHWAAPAAPRPRAASHWAAGGSAAGSLVAFGRSARAATANWWRGGSSRLCSSSIGRGWCGSAPRSFSRSDPETPQLSSDLLSRWRSHLSPPAHWLARRRLDSHWPAQLSLSAAPRRDRRRSASTARRGGRHRR